MFSGAARAEETTVTYKSLTPEVALEAARAALQQCRTDGYQVSVAVVDRFGETQVLLRDRYAGLPANQTAVDKAWTSVGFRADTSQLAASVKDGTLDPRLANRPRIAMLGGALKIEGVSGAPGGDKDEKCARAGLDAIRDKLDF
jgi:uncharacterized protein GlcG (DUF336 family)